MIWNDEGYGAEVHKLTAKGFNEKLAQWVSPDFVALAKAFGGEGSMGNGGAMRAAPIGAYFADDLDRVAREARASAEPTHAHVYAAARVAMDRFANTTVPVVLPLIPAEVRQQFKSATGQELGAYMAECTTATLYSAGSSQVGARKVLAQWARLQLVDEAKAIALAAAAPDVDVKALLRELAASVDDLSSSLRRSGRPKSTYWFGEASRAALEASQLARNAKGITGIATGFADLDRIMGGLQRGDLIIGGARPSMGKTTLGTSVALTAARAGHGVGILSLEMGADKVTARMLADLAYRRSMLIPYQDIITGTITDGDFEQLAILNDQVQSLPIRIDDSAGLTISDIRAKVERMVADFAEAGFTLDMLVIDHLLKVRSTNRYSGNRVLELGEITEGIKELAREFNLAALLLTQLNRAVEQREDKHPTLADLRDSGAIEQDADCVLLLYREAYYLEREKPSDLNRELERDANLAACRHVAEVEVAKQRNGRLGTIELFADMACSHFGNAARNGYAENYRAA